MTRPDERTGTADPTDRQLVVDLDRQLRQARGERDALVQRIQHAREILTRAAAGCCGDTVHHIGEADRVLGGES